jgi:hypothetical protein
MTTVPTVSAAIAALSERDAELTGRRLMAVAHGFHDAGQRSVADLFHAVACEVLDHATAQRRVLADLEDDLDTKGARVDDVAAFVDEVTRQWHTGEL